MARRQRQSPDQTEENNQAQQDQTQELIGDNDLRPPARELSIAQLRAIPLMLEGRSNREVAEILGLHWVTVCRWRTLDEAYMAEYDRQRALLYHTDLQQARARLRAHLHNGDPKWEIAAAKTLVDADVGYQRANSTVTHTVILDKLAAALQSLPDTVDAEYQAIAEGADTPALPEPDEA